MPMSTVWQGGTKQQHEGWCWAAATQAVVRAFGQNVTQEQIVHDWLMSDQALAADNEDDDYKTQMQLRALKSGHTGFDYATLLRLPAADLQALRDISEDWWGNAIPLAAYIAQDMVRVPDAGRTYANAVSLLRRPGLILMGSDTHWRIAAGFTDAGQTLAVWDPATAQIEQELVAAAIALTPNWYRVS